MQLVAGSSITAAKLLTSFKKDVVMNWDGGRHHCKRDSSAGFCYVNDIVLAIQKLHEKFDRVMYIDVDVHHGDGVEHAFEYSSSVYTISFHLKDVGFYPGFMINNFRNGRK